MRRYDVFTFEAVPHVDIFNPLLVNVGRSAHQLYTCLQFV